MPQNLVGSVGRRSLVRPVLLGLALAAWAVLAPPTTGASAAGPGGWDHVGDAGAPGTDSLNGQVHALATGATFLYVGGDFTDAGGNAIADRIAITDGSNWASLTPSSSGISNGGVFAIAVAGSKLYVGGTFTNAAGNGDADFVATVSDNGLTWDPVCNGAGPPVTANVNALQVIGSTLYIGGSFQNAGGIVSADYLVACDLNTGTLSATTIDPSHPFTGPIFALTKDSNGALYAGGSFSNLENLGGADNVAYLNESGWHAMGTGSGPCGCAVDGYVRSLTASGTDVYVGTDVKDVAGIPQADNVARWNGSAWSAVGSDAAGTDGWFPASTFIYGMTTSGSSLFATGTFQNAGGDPLADHVAQFSGGSWQPIGSDGAGNGPWIGNGLALATYGGRLFAGGSFTSAGGDGQAAFAASYPLSPPETTITAGPEGPTSDNMPTWEFSSSEPGSTFICTVTIVATGGSATGPCASPWQSNLLPDGEYKFGVSATSGAGAPDPTPATRTFQVDTKKPALDVSGSKVQAPGPTIAVIVSCGEEPCTVAATGKVSVSGAAKSSELRGTTKQLTAGDEAKLKLRVPKRTQKTISEALRHDGKVTAKVSVLATDDAGNTRKSRRSVKISR